MRYRFAEIFCVATLVCCFSGCGETGNYNANANRNANANTNTSVANANANTSPSPRRGLTREDYERDKDRYAGEAKELGRKIGNGLNDGWLWAKTRFELAAADDLRDSTINVDVNNDAITLTGTVATADQKARAEAVAKSVEGVKSIRNLLKVAPSGNTNQANRSK